MKKRRYGQMSESILVGICLALTGGFLDAYSFICRGEVFANAQTGNIALFGANLFEREYVKALKYLIPILAFAIGVFIVEEVKHRYKENKTIHWRQIVLAFEIVLLMIVGFISKENNNMANVIVSFVCSLQVDSFRKVRNKTFATTMCTGNLRSGTALLCTYRVIKDKSLRSKALDYYAIILVFIIGAGIGGICSSLFHEKSIIFCVIPLIICFFVMFIREEKAGDIYS